MLEQMIVAGGMFHDHARPHVELQKFSWEVFDHPACSLDLAPSDYHLFQNMKRFLAKLHFHSDESVQTDDRHRVLKECCICFIKCFQSDKITHNAFFVVGDADLTKNDGPTGEAHVVSGHRVQNTYPIVNKLVLSRWEEPPSRSTDSVVYLHYAENR
ncbi:hypothetical protein AVEN_231825-1 [Araneus ventricosus]|uniref:Uncharacterized protein n=1 Tax=Araneus ventricosus TaxID=182803 RepID=A0A4Y2P1Q4_ARAVE|nr:hypothetical protein AVEN_231825-1 [Araneus ventricosus]